MKEISLEEQINEILAKKGPFTIQIEVWLWDDVRHRNITVDSTDEYWPEVNQLIRSAPLAECLTSPSEYIREYRKAYEKKEII